MDGWDIGIVIGNHRSILPEMVRYYDGELAKLSDDELRVLSAEIEDAGITGIEEIYDYDESDWAFQAYRRHDDIRKELERRWEAANPEEAEARRKRRQPLVDIIAMATKKYCTSERFTKMFDQSDEIAKLIRKR